MKVSQIPLVTLFECRNIPEGDLFEVMGSFLERLTLTGSDFSLKDFLFVCIFLAFFSHIPLHHLNDHTLNVRRRSPKLELRYSM